MSEQDDRLVSAFVAGARWWEYEKTGVTMWPYYEKAEAEALKRKSEGTLGMTDAEAVEHRRKEGK